MPIGEHIIRLDHVQSTNQYLKENRSNLPSGAVVLTREQTDGRGRGDKKWLSSPDKSLTFSFLLSESKKNNLIPIFHLFPAVAVIQCLKTFHVDAKIKWPNDIFVDGKKIGGLLVEIISHADGIDVIIGIGLNVLQDEKDFPKELHQNAGSIKSITGVTIEIEDLFQSLLDQINAIYERYSQQSTFIELQTLWCKECAHLNQNITIFQSDKKINGKFVGLDENGFAVILSGDQSIVVRDYEYVSLRQEHDTHN